MDVKLFIGAEGAYACIKTLHANMDVRLEPGRSAAQSLRKLGDEWRAKAAHLQQRAMYLNEAAALLEEQEKARHE